MDCSVDRRQLVQRGDQCPLSPWLQPGTAQKHEDGIRTCALCRLITDARPVLGGEGLTTSDGSVAGAAARCLVKYGNSDAVGSVAGAAAPLTSLRYCTRRSSDAQREKSKHIRARRRHKHKRANGCDLVRRALERVSGRRVTCLWRPAAPNATTRQSALPSNGLMPRSRRTNRA